MIEKLSTVVESGGVLAGLALLGLSILRFVGLRASKDAITLKADHSDRDAFDRLIKRVDLLDGRVNELETVRNHLFGFVTKCMAYISQCAACDYHNETDRQALRNDYSALLEMLNQHYGERRKEPR